MSAMDQEREKKIRAAWEEVKRDQSWDWHERPVRRMWLRSDLPLVFDPEPPHVSTASDEIITVHCRMMYIRGERIARFVAEGIVLDEG